MVQTKEQDIKKMKKGAIFDMDGLMFDTERVYQETWEELGAEYGVTLGDAFAREICGTAGDREKEILCRYYHTDDAESLLKENARRVRQKLTKVVPEKPGIREILAFFKENGVRTAVASSSPIELIRHNLVQTGLDQYIDSMISGANLEHGKPAPDVFLKAAESIGLPAEDCYVFEDAYNGVRAGHAAGAYTVMIPDILPPDDEMRAKADLICDTLTEALAIIRS